MKRDWNARSGVTDLRAHGSAGPRVLVMELEEEDSAGSIVRSPAMIMVTTVTEEAETVL